MVKELSLRSALAACVAAGAFGAGLSFARHAGTPVATVPAPIAAPTSMNRLGPSPFAAAPDVAPATSPSANGLESLWLAFKAAGTEAEEAKIWLRLSEMTDRDPVLFRQLMARYDPQADARTKKLLRFILSGNPDHREEVERFSLGLAASGDVLRRRDGFAFLAQAPIHGEPVRKLAVQALKGEHDPGVLTGAATIVGRNALEPQEATALVPALRPLVTHADAELRASAVYALAKLDKASGAQAEVAVALADPAAEVRQAAVTALLANGTRSEQLKEGLWTVLNSRLEEPGLRYAASAALERYPLDAVEHARFEQMRREVVTTTRLQNQRGG
jgi:hypothetical protein